MHPVIYDVAVSVDGYISGPDGDISGFAHEGAVVEAYLARLATYRCAIMGRRTYEFGYRFGLRAGQNPYPHMRTLVFSTSLALPEGSEVEVVREDALDVVNRLRRDGPGPIYLCGGGHFAASLLRAGLIDRLRLKQAPILLGGGVRLFEGATQPGPLSCTDTHDYGDGTLFRDFALP